MKGTSSQRILYRPVHGSFKHVRIVVIQSKDETAIDHDTERMKTADGLFVIATDVLSFVALEEIVAAERFEADEDAAHAGRCRGLYQVSPKDSIDSRGALED